MTVFGAAAAPGQPTGPVALGRLRGHVFLRQLLDMVHGRGGAVLLLESEVALEEELHLARTQVLWGGRRNGELS